MPPSSKKLFLLQVIKRLEFRVWRLEVGRWIFYGDLRTEIWDLRRPDVKIPCAGRTWPACMFIPKEACSDSA